MLGYMITDAISLPHYSCCSRLQCTKACCLLHDGNSVDIAVVIVIVLLLLWLFIVVAISILVIYTTTVPAKPNANQNKPKQSNNNYKNKSNHALWLNISFNRCSVVVIVNGAV